MSNKQYTIICRHTFSASYNYLIELDKHTFSKDTWHIFENGKKYYIVGLSDGSGNLIDLKQIKNVNDFKNKRIFYSSDKMNHENFLKRSKEIRATYPVKVIMNLI